MYLISYSDLVLLIIPSPLIGGRLERGVAKLCFQTYKKYLQFLFCCFIFVAVMGYVLTLILILFFLGLFVRLVWAIIRWFDRH